MVLPDLAVKRHARVVLHAPRRRLIIFWTAKFPREESEVSFGKRLNCAGHFAGSLGKKVSD